MAVKRFQIKKFKNLANAPAGKQGPVSFLGKTRAPAVQTCCHLGDTGGGGWTRPAEVPGQLTCLAPGRMWDRPKGRAEPRLEIGRLFSRLEARSQEHEPSLRCPSAPRPARAWHVVGTRHLQTSPAGPLSAMPTKGEGGRPGPGEWMGKPAWDGFSATRKREETISCFGTSRPRLRDAAQRCPLPRAIHPHSTPGWRGYWVTPSLPAGGISRVSPQPHPAQHVHPYDHSGHLHAW